MATKCIVLEEVLPPPGTPIVFIHFINSVVRLINGDERVQPAETHPSEFDYIELVQKGTDGEYDLMFAYYTNQRDRGNLYLGAWNDGFVEPIE